MINQKIDAILTGIAATSIALYGAITDNPLVFIFGVLVGATGSIIFKFIIRLFKNDSD